jgi:hypothetical protein
MCRLSHPFFLSKVEANQICLTLFLNYKVMPLTSGTIYFCRENPHLCKNMIGEYISNKKNLDVLKSFVISFDFRGLR